MIDKIIEALLKKPLDKVNALTSGYKLYSAGLISVLTGLAILLGELFAQPLDVARLQVLLHSEGLKMVIAGIGLIGHAHKMEKASETPKP